MINRDNLAVETDNFCCAVSVSKKQWPFAEDIIKQIKREIPGIEFDIPSAWAYHNAGYYYKEIRIGHTRTGYAFDAMRQINEVIRFIPLK